MDDSKERLILLDLMRFVAAMAVLIYHYKSKYIETLQADAELASAIYSITKFGYLGVVIAVNRQGELRDAFAFAKRGAKGGKDNAQGELTKAHHITTPIVESGGQTAKTPLKLIRA